VCSDYHTLTDPEDVLLSDHLNQRSENYALVIPRCPRQAAKIILENFTPQEIDDLINFLYPDDR
jgi:hypothetical protein